MTPDEFAKLQEHVLRHNGWKHSLVRTEEDERYKERPLIKYITGHLDTREGIVHSVVFRCGGTDISFDLTDEDKVKEMYLWLNNAI